MEKLLEHGRKFSVSNLILRDSEINFSPEEQENFHTLTIDGNYQAKNALLHMKGKLRKMIHRLISL